MFADHGVGYLEPGVSTGQTYWEAQSPRDAEIELLGIGHAWGAGFLTQKRGFLEGGGGGSVNF